MIKAIIFDLDDTLFPSTILSREARLKACEAMISAGLPAKNTQEAYKTLRQIVKEHGSNYTEHFSRLCEAFLIKPSPKIIAAGIIAYHDVKIYQLKVFPKVMETLLRLREKNIRLFLLSAGNKVKQWEKIHLLKIEPYFTGIKIISTEEKKEESIRKIIEFAGVSNKEVLVVGDRPEKELIAAHRSGAVPVRVLQGKHKLKEPPEELSFMVSVKTPADILRVVDELNASEKTIEY